MTNDDSIRLGVNAQLAGGDAVVPGTRNTARRQALLHSSGCLVTGLHLCRDDQHEAFVSWGLGMALSVIVERSGLSSLCKKAA